MRKASELTAVIKRRLEDDESREFETFFYGWLERTDATLLKEIRATAELSDGLRDAVTRAVQGAKREFRGTPVEAPTQDSYREDGGEA